jgi:hypothetical protein
MFRIYNKDGTLTYKGLLFFDKKIKSNIKKIKKNQKSNKSLVDKLSKELYGYLIHYTIYFYFLTGRLPLSVDEFFSFLSKHNNKTSEVLQGLYKLKTLSKEQYQKLIKLWFYKIHKKSFLKLINLLKSKYFNNPNLYNSKTCKFQFEALHQFVKQEYNTRKNEVRYKVKFYKPDILIVCKDKVVVIELKSGNRKLWKKYEKQIKDYLKFLKQIYPSKNLFGILYYYKSDVIKEFSI